MDVALRYAGKDPNAMYQLQAAAHASAGDHLTPALTVLALLHALLTPTLF